MVRKHRLRSILPGADSRTRAFGIEGRVIHFRVRKSGGLIAVNSISMEPVTQHIAQARQVQHPAISDNFSRSKSFIRVRGEVLLADLHQTRRFIRES